MFWSAYPEALRAAKLGAQADAQRIWRGLTDEERRAAVKWAPKMAGVKRKHPPAAYLRKRMWNELSQQKASAGQSYVNVRLGTPAELAWWEAYRAQLVALGRRDPGEVVAWPDFHVRMIVVEADVGGRVERRQVPALVSRPSLFPGPEVARIAGARRRGEAHHPRAGREAEHLEMGR